MMHEQQPKRMERAFSNLAVGGAGMIRPRVFIGSSSEALTDQARLVASVLGNEVTSIVWRDSSEFQHEPSIMYALINAAKSCDFAVFVLSPDDFTSSRQKDWRSPRDNVLFEWGLFVGELGVERVLAIQNSGPNLKIPSDVFGINIPSFEGNNNDDLKASISNALESLRVRIPVKKLVSFGSDFTSGYGFNETQKVFHFTVNMERAKTLRGRLQGRALIVVSRWLNDDVYNESTDSNISISVPRPIDLEATSNEFRLTGAPLDLTRAPEGIVEVRGILMLCDKDTDVSDCKTLEDLRRLGCYVIRSNVKGNLREVMKELGR